MPEEENFLLSFLAQSVKSKKFSLKKYIIIRCCFLLFPVDKSDAILSTAFKQK